MAKAVTLSNGKTWKTKKAATSHFREMLSRYRDGQKIENADDHGDLVALLERVDLLISEDTSKVGSGIDHFERRLNRGDGWSAPGFWAVRTDGTETDFSYVKAVQGTPKSPDQEFYDACHNAVSKDLLTLKQRRFDHFADADGCLLCDLTDNPITYDEAELSHADPPFSKIVADFRELQGWKGTLPSHVLTRSADAQLSTHFADAKTSEAFRHYHHGVAIMRIVSSRRGVGLPSLRAAPVRRPLKLV